MSSPRYDLGGLSEEEKAQAALKADEISAKYPSIGRTEVLGHIRQLRSRLGDFHHAIENVETLTKAQVVLGTLGHGENASEDLEKLVLGLESQGIGSQPEKFKTYLNAFTRAKSLFPDLRGEDFRQYMQRANVSKYGLSEDYLTSVVPTMMQHEGASNFGVMQASAFSALVGHRQTKAAKAAMRRFGLVDGNDRLLNESDFIKSPFKWAEANIVPALQKHGIATDEEHRGEVVKAMTEMFSNRKVGEFFASMIVNRAIIEKDSVLLPRAKGTEAAEQVRREDPFAAWAGVTTQLKDVATAFIGVKPIIDAMNAASNSLGNIAKTIETGHVPENTNLGRIIHANSRTPAEWSEIRRRDNMKAQTGEIDNKLAHFPLDEPTKRRLRLRRFDLQMGIDQSENQATMPPLFSPEELDRWQEMDREHRRGVALSSMPAPMRGGKSRIPLPMEDPRGRLPQMPPVQPLDAAPTRVDVTGTVEGQLIGKIVIEDGTGLLKIRNDLDRVIKLVGSMFTGGGNGPGSAGHSSPDAAAASSGIAYGP
ncbi:hypothetical protein [Nitrobacter sp.]|uniref:hypothetical protein n=1 Tax=Nitrobacter sp. TaxID=29420 RepID=UPI003F64B22C